MNVAMLATALLPLLIGAMVSQDEPAGSPRDALAWILFLVAIGIVALAFVIDPCAGERQ